jgi:menaquinone-9 beta-reductase
MKNFDYEIGIIGGGPAGSAAAIFLTDLGFEVCLFEKNNFPREILCGEFLSREVVHFLKSLNLFEDFLAFNPNPINHFKFYNNNDTVLTSSLGFTGYGLRRSVFDSFLLNIAKKKGTVVYQPAEVKNIVNRKNRFTLSVFEDDRKQITVKTVIAAYGKQNVLDKILFRKFINKRSGLNGIKFHVKNELIKNYKDDEIGIYAGKNIYCGVNKVDNDNFTLCFLENRARIELPPRKQLPKLMKENDDFGKIFRDDIYDIFNNLPIYGTGNIYFGQRELYKDGIYMIGDSAGVIAPLAGDGIGMAVESAQILAEILYDHNLNSFLNVPELYQKMWEQKFKKRKKTAKLLQKTVLSSYLRNTAVGLTKKFPFIMEKFIAQTRG